MLKSEARNPNIEIRNKFKILMTKNLNLILTQSDPF
jgi:hypothetical protein